jgi:hypothetical protein
MSEPTESVSFNLGDGTPVTINRPSAYTWIMPHGQRCVVYGEVAHINHLNSLVKCCDVLHEAISQVWWTADVAKSKQNQLVPPPPQTRSDAKDVP